MTDPRIFKGAPVELHCFGRGYISELRADNVNGELVADIMVEGGVSLEVSLRYLVRVLDNPPSCAL